MSKKIVWTDKQYKKYTIDEISDNYLVNILKFISNGGGYVHYMSKKKIKKLFKEADKRGLQHNGSLKLALLRYSDKILAQNFMEFMMDYIYDVIRK